MAAVSPQQRRADGRKATHRLRNDRRREKGKRKSKVSIRQSRGDRERPQGRGNRGALSAEGGQQGAIISKLLRSAFVFVLELEAENQFPQSVQYVPAIEASALYTQHLQQRQPVTHRMTWRSSYNTSWIYPETNTHRNAGRAGAVSHGTARLPARLAIRTLTFQGDDFAGGVHDGTVGRDGPPDWVSGVRHVHDHNLVLLTHLLSDADELVGLHGQIAEPNVGRVHAQVLQLEVLLK